MRLLARAFLLCALAWSVAGAQPAAPVRRLERASDFWGISGTERSERWEVDFEFHAFYADPTWNLLWGEAEGAAIYLPLAVGEAPRIASGQRARLRGTVVPARGFSRREIEVTVLEQNTWPEPIPVDLEKMKDRQLNARLVEVEGVVVQQFEVDPSHVEYRLLVEGFIVEMRMQMGPSDSFPQLQGLRVKARGVYVGAHDGNGELVQVDLWLPQRHDLRVLGTLADDPRFQLPPTPLDELPASLGRDWVRVVGTVYTHEPGTAVTIRDDTGQIAVASAQPGSLPPGTRLEIVGRPARSAEGMTLTAPLWRRDDRAAPIPVPMTRIRVAARVLELSAEDAARGHPVDVRGVVTWSHPNANFFFVEDASAGIRVAGRAAGESAPAVGTSVRVVGVTAMGGFAPEVRLEQVTTDATVARPKARNVTLEQVMTGHEEGRLVALRGYLRGISVEDGWPKLDMVTPTGEFAALVPPETDVSGLVGAVVRATGVAASRADEQGRLTGFQLWVPSASALDVEEPKRADPFDRPRQSIVSLRRFNRLQAAVPTARVAGRVVASGPGYFFVQEGNAGVQVLVREGAPPAVGVVIDVVGLLGSEGRRTVLREGRWRPSSENVVAPSILSVSDAATPRPEADGALVRVEARLVDVRRRNGDSRLLFQAGDRSFEASIPGAVEWLPGSRLLVTGVYLVEYDETGQARAFELRLRTPEDVILLGAPSRWTARRLASVLAIVGLASAAGLAWIVILRRQVSRQTAQIRAQWDRENRMQAELERSTRLESLGVLAGGIAHDFNNLLTAILGNLGLIALDPNAMGTSGQLVENARRATRRAGDITQQLLTFAKGGDPIRKAVPLADLVREAAGFALHGSSVLAEFDLPADLPPAEVDAAQVTRVIHNLVLNAAQAMPTGGLVRFELREANVGEDEIEGLRAGRYLRLTVSDDGPGIAPAELARLFEPYFSTKQGNSGLGLAVVRSIIQKHEGQVAVESERGRGTVFKVWLPVATSLPEPPPEPAGLASSTPRRVLLMDDEEIIRDTAALALASSGHEATVVPDGAAAVKAYADAHTAGRPFEVVILDLTVPGGMGGEQAVREILKIDPAARVVVSSGYSSNPVMARFRDYGFCAVVPKPYELAGLLRAVEFAAVSSRA